MYSAFPSCPTAPAVAAALAGTGVGPMVVRTSRRSPSGWSLRITFGPRSFPMAQMFARRWHGAVRRSATGCWVLTVAVSGLRGVPLAAIERVCRLAGVIVSL